MAFDTNDIRAFTHSCYAAGEDTDNNNFTPPPSPFSPLSGFAISPGAPADFYNLNYTLSGQNDDVVIDVPCTQGTSNHHGGDAKIVGVLYNRDQSTALHTVSAVNLIPAQGDAADAADGALTSITCKLDATAAVYPAGTIIATVDTNNLTVYYQLTAVNPAGTTTLFPICSGYKATGPNMRRKQHLGYL